MAGTAGDAGLPEVATSAYLNTLSILKPRHENDCVHLVMNYCSCSTSETPLCTLMSHICFRSKKVADDLFQISVLNK